MNTSSRNETGKPINARREIKNCFLCVFSDAVERENAPAGPVPEDCAMRASVFVTEKESKNGEACGDAVAKWGRRWGERGKKGRGGGDRSNETKGLWVEQTRPRQWPEVAGGSRC